MSISKLYFMTTIRYSVKDMFQRYKNIFCRQICRLLFRNDIDIPTTCYIVLVQTKKLAAKPFDSVANDGVSDLLRNSDPKARPILTPPAEADNEIPAVNRLIRTR